MNRKGFATLAIVLIVVAALAAIGVWRYTINKSASPSPFAKPIRVTANCANDTPQTPACASGYHCVPVSEQQESPGVLYGNCVPSVATTSTPSTPHNSTTTPVTTSLLITLPGTAFPIQSGTQYLEPAPINETLQYLTLTLEPSPQQKAALDAFLQNPSGHPDLTVEQYTALYAPSQQDADVASAWLVQNGFTIDDVPVNRMLISFHGTIGQVEKAFHIQINNYLLTTGRQCHASPDDQKVPQSLSSFVGGVILSNCTTYEPGSSSR